MQEATRGPPLQRHRPARAVAQQPLQARAVVRCNAHAGVHREAAVLVAQHLLDLGAVGKRKYAYDVWGDTVNIASRMESAAEPGRVNVSA